MNNIYFIADTHFGHTNVIKYCDRPYASAEKMNEALINNWNSVVKPNDKIYHLGDLAFCPTEELTSIIDRLNGKKYLIRGNHDGKSLTCYEKLGFTVLTSAPIKIDEYKIILSHVPLPDSMIPEGYINIHGHIHNKPLNGVYQKRGRTIEEYPVKLYSPEKHKCVSVDVINFTPISLADLLK